MINFSATRALTMASSTPQQYFLEDSALSGPIKLTGNEPLHLNPPQQ
jgi:hypothetical protein